MYRNQRLRTLPNIFVIALGESDVLMSIENTIDRYKYLYVSHQQQSFLTARPWAGSGSCSTLGLFFLIFFLSETRRRSPLGQLWITQSVMFTRQTLFLQGQQKSQITKSRRTYTLQKNLFKTLTSKRYITLALIATTHRQKVNLFLNNPALSC